MTIAAVSAATDNTTIALGDSSETPMAESPNANSSISIQSDNTSSVSEDDEKRSSENSGKLLVSDDETKEIFYDNKYYLFRGDCWTINNNFESSASITSDTVNDLTITGVFRTQSDCVGLYWNSQDIINHPYISYGNRSNYTDVVLEFDYKMTGCMDFSNTVITIEANTGETYYLSMNRFVKNNHLKLDFNKLTLLPGNTYINKNGRPITVLRETSLNVENLKSIMFSIVPSNFIGNYNLYIIMRNTNFTCQISNITVTNGEICNEQPPLAPHQYRLCEGYDDIYNLNPFRLCKEMRKLGYVEWVDLYVGASNFYEKSGIVGDVIVDLGFTYARTEKMVLNKNVPLNNAFRAWLDCYSRELKNNDGKNIIISISMENLQCPQSWRQMDCNGNYAKTGWSPSTFFYSPCHKDVIPYVQKVSEACLDIVVNNGFRPILQMGETWWWWNEFNEIQTPCFYDSSTRAKYLAEHGTPLPEYDNANVTEYDKNATKWLNQQLVKYSDALRSVVKGDKYNNGIYMALFFPPSVTDSDEVPPMMKDINYLKDAYTPSKLDILQIEDYFWVIYESPHHPEAYSLGQELGFSEDQLHYFGGFVQNPEDASLLWELIEESMNEAIKKDFKEVFVWAGSQVRRDNKILGHDEENILENLSPTAVTAPTYVSVGEIFTIEVNTQEWLNGILHIYEYNHGKKSKLLTSAAIINGSSAADLSCSNAGLNRLYLEFDYSGGDYHIIQEVSVIENSKDITVDVPFEIDGETSANITLNAPKSQSAFIYISIDNKSPNNYPVKNGKFTQEIPELSHGTHTISIKYNEGNYLNGNAYSNTFRINVHDNTNIEVNNVTCTYNSGQNLTVTLKDNEGKALKGKEISINLNGAEHKATTDANGRVTVKIGQLPGNYIATISFNGDNAHSPSSAIANVIVNKISTGLACNDINVVYGNAANLVITLKDNGGHAIIGKEIIIHMNNVEYKKTTDANGQAKLSVRLPANNHIAKINFEGDNIYKSSALTTRIVVKKAATSLTASNEKFKSKSKSKKITVALKTNKNKPVVKVIIKLTIKKKTYKARTNSKGIATFKVKLTKKRQIQGDLQVCRQFQL